MRIVVGGFAGLFPTGGVTWDYLQYVAGLAELGHEVWYLEDTGTWPVFDAGASDDLSCRPALAHLDATTAAFGIAGRWAYRDEMTGAWFGLDDRTRRDVLRRADVFVNLSCSTMLRDELQDVPVRVLLDTDPMFTQIQCVETLSLLHEGEGVLGGLLAAHTHHATFGERVGASDCAMPACGVRWIPTRQPVCLSRWPVRPLPADGAFTTVMNWSASRSLRHAGRTWGQKDVEMQRVMDLPRRVPEALLTAVIGNQASPEVPLAELAAAGWTLPEPAATVRDWQSYQRFLEASAGEFSVAKHTYVQARTGWFSCRSACYLAAGRPVVAQDTGWSHVLPHGEGLLAFDDVEGAEKALRTVLADPEGHGRAARAVAESHFDSDPVLSRLLDEVTAR